MAPSFDSLPLDIHYLIFSYLSLAHTAPQAPHPLVGLTLTSTHFRDLVKSYSSHRLQHIFLRWPKLEKAKPILTQKRPLRSLLRYLTTYCTFCAAKTSLSAAIYPYIACCRRCDKEQWPNKITLTDARKRYRLTREELIDNVRHGEYYCFTVLTTVFLQNEVEAYVDRTKPGGLKALEMKREVREKAQRDRIATKHKELRAMLPLNGIDESEFDRLSGNLVIYTARHVVREELLRRRLEAQNIERRSQELRDRGYINQRGEFPIIYVRRFGDRDPDSEDPYDELVCREVVGEILSELWMAEFADGGRVPKYAFAAMQHSENSDWKVLLDKAFMADGSQKLHTPPWGWYNYPVKVKTAWVEPEGKDQKTLQKAKKKWESEERRAERAWPAMKEALRRNVERGEWIRRNDD